MKVILIYPPQENFVSDLVSSEIVRPEAGVYPPLGLLSIAGYLKENSSYEIEVIDAMAEKLDHSRLKERIRKSNPDVIGIYFCTHYLYDSILAAKSAKEISPAILTVAGGPHIYFYPFETIDIPEIDYVVCGEGEIIFKELIDSLAAKNEAAPLSGVITKKNRDRAPFAKQRIPDLDILPFPARSLSPYRSYSSIVAKGKPITTLMSSRGCPYNCYFCSNIEREQKVRFRSALKVVDEMEECAKMGIRNILFFDELFTVNRSRVIEICDELIRRRIGVKWHIRSRADTLDEEMVKKLKKAGCRMIQFGIESGSPRIQQVINKKLNLDKVANNIKMVHDNGILTFADFIFGLPGETAGERMQTIEFAKNLKLDYACFGIYHPIPATEFYRRGLSEGRIKSDYWKGYVDNPAKKITTYYWPGFDTGELDRFVERAYRGFYLRPHYLLQRLLRTDSLSQLLWLAKSGLKVLSKLFLQGKTL